MKLGKNGIIKYFENLLREKYNDYVLVNKNIVKAVVEILKND